MKKLTVDVAIIGHGTAGSNAYRAARTHTKKIVTIESGPYGTTCARVGCMPSKLLIAAAEAAHMMHKAPKFGVHPKEVHINGKEVMQRVRSERDRFVGFVLEGVASVPEEHRIRGRAQFIDAHTLQIDDHTYITAKSIVIATGSTPVMPPQFQELGDRLIINDDVFEWTDLPNSVAVFGTGIIALELGQALNRLGVKVTIFGRSGKIGPISDPVVQKISSEIFSQELDFQGKHPEIQKMSRKVSQQSAISSQQSDGGVRDVLPAEHTSQEIVEIEFLDGDGKQRTEEYEYVLVALGRSPNVQNIGLENTGIELDKQGIPLFDHHTLQCGKSHIFMAGDVTANYALLHEAADEGRIAGENAALFPNIQNGFRRTPLTVMFTDPQITIVGDGYKSLKQGSFVTGQVLFAGQGRSRVMLVNRGVLHVYAQKSSGKFLGAEMCGPAAEHIGHLLSWSLQQELTIEHMLQMPFYHPVIEEGLKTALNEAQQQLLHAV